MDLAAVRRAAETPVAITADSFGATAQDLADAFSDDPVMDWVMRPDARRAQVRLAFFRALLRGVTPPEGVVQRPATGGAAAIWLESEAMRPSTFIEDLKLLPTLLRVTGGRRMPRLARLRAAMDGAHPKAPHAYLWFLGVAPEAQGAGVGTRLLKAQLDRLDAAGRPAYLEASSPRNRSLYTRHGFEDRGEIRPAPDSPPLWAMWREPQR